MARPASARRRDRCTQLNRVGWFCTESVISRRSTVQPKPVGPSPPCGGRLAGRKSMYAGRVSKKRCAVASGRSKGHDCGNPSEAHDHSHQDLSMRFRQRQRLSRTLMRSPVVQSPTTPRSGLWLFVPLLLCRRRPPPASCPDCSAPRGAEDVWRPQTLMAALAPSCWRGQSRWATGLCSLAMSLSPRTGLRPIGAAWGPGARAGQGRERGSPQRPC